MLVLEARDIVGESLIWSQRDQALLWVDIVGRRIHSLDPLSGDHAVWSTPDFPTSIGPRSRGGFVVGLRRTVCFWTPDGPFEPLAEPEPDLPDNRLNEGKVAPDGSFWVGTMQDNLEDDGSPKDMDRGSGAYYRIDPGGAVSQLTPRDFGVTNTMIWLGAGRFVGADTTKNELYAFDEDPVSHHLTAKRQFGPRFERGLPDGSTPDSAGGFWNCRVLGGGCVIRLAREGELDRVVDLPCSSPTSCAFGGPDLSTLYVTSSRFGMSEDHLSTNQHEGGLFAVDVGMTGVPEHQFAG